MLPGHAAAATKENEKDRSEYFFSKRDFFSARFIEKLSSTTDEDNPKKRRAEGSLSPPPHCHAFPRSSSLSCTLSPAAEEIDPRRSGIVPVVHAPITICLHEILGFFFRHGRQEKISLQEEVLRVRTGKMRAREKEGEMPRTDRIGKDGDGRVRFSVRNVCVCVCAETSTRKKDERSWKKKIRERKRWISLRVKRRRRRQRARMKRKRRRD